MAFENLTEREKLILNNLIDYYISTADPVGSRVIANKFKMGISSATIRNTLQDLEELGLVQQPHISAGRIPTDLGYRFYVDYLVKPEQLTEKEKQFIKKSLLKEGKGVNEILGQTCRILSEITDQLGIAIAPTFESGILRRINLVPISGDRIMVIVVVESGLARTMLLEVEVNFSDKDLREVESVINERLSGLSLGQINKTISQRMADISGKGKLLQLLVDSKDKIWTESDSGDIRLAGTDHLFNKPEFADISRVSNIMRLLENSSVLSQLFNQAVHEGLVITIGEENKVREIINCSMVTSQYKVGNVVGTIGIVGPTRMHYSKLLSVVDYTARAITDMLSSTDYHKESKNDR